MNISFIFYLKNIKRIKDCSSHLLLLPLNRAEQWIRSLDGTYQQAREGIVDTIDPY